MNKRHYEHTLPNIRGSLSNTYVLSDPNNELSVNEVMDFYSMTYPELTTATVHGPEWEEDKAVYRFKTTIGVKG